MDERLARYAAFAALFHYAFVREGACLLVSLPFHRVFCFHQLRQRVEDARAPRVTGNTHSAPRQTSEPRLVRTGGRFAQTDRSGAARFRPAVEIVRRAFFPLVARPALKEKHERLFPCPSFVLTIHSYLGAFIASVDPEFRRRRKKSPHCSLRLTRPPRFYSSPGSPAAFLLTGCKPVSFSLRRRARA